MCGGLCGGRRQNHLGAPQNQTFRGPTQGGPGICNCTKLPGDFLAARFSFGVLLKPNPSPGPFSDEKIKAQGGEAWTPPTELDGELFTWRLHTGPSALSAEAVEQHSGMATPRAWGTGEQLVVLPPLPVPKLVFLLACLSGLRNHSCPV